MPSSSLTRKTGQVTKTKILADQHRAKRIPTISMVLDSYRNVKGALLTVSKGTTELNIVMTTKENKLLIPHSKKLLKMNNLSTVQHNFALYVYNYKILLLLRNFFGAAVSIYIKK